jgi:hypothetical protein
MMVCRAHERASGHGGRDIIVECFDDTGKKVPLPEGRRQIFSLWCDPRTPEGLAYLRQEAERRWVPVELIDQAVAKLVPLV